MNSQEDENPKPNPEVNRYEIKKPLRPETKVQNQKKPSVLLTYFNSLGDRLGKTIIILIVSFIALGIIGVVGYMANIDVYFANIQLEGAVVNSLTEEPIEGLEITLPEFNKNYISPDGYFIFHNLELGEIIVEINNPDYVAYSEVITLEKQPFNYTTQLLIQLTPAGEAILSGQFVTEQADHDFFDDTLFIGNQEFSIKQDGSFVIPNAPVGETTLLYQSSNFKNVTKSIIIDPGINELDSISIEPSGDISVDLLSFVTEEPVTNINVVGENISNRQIIVQEEISKLDIIDLNVDQEYTIRVSTPGYESRDYSFSVNQGQNSLPEFSLVREGIEYFFLAEGDRLAEISLISVNRDGFNKRTVQLLPNDIFPANVYMDQDNNISYFISNHERVRTTFSSQADLIYGIDLQTGTINRVFTRDENVGDLRPNFESRRVINIFQPERRVQEFTIETTSLTGSTTKFIQNSTDYILDAILADDGTSAYFVKQATEGSQEYITFIDTITLQEQSLAQISNVTFYDISEDGNRVIFAGLDSNSGFSDLYMYDINTSELRTLIERRSGFNYEFLENSNSIFYYIDEQNGETNLFSFDIASSDVTQITDLGPTNIPTFFFQQSGYIYYQTDDSLFVLDPAISLNFKKVLDGVVLN